jgi:hypothetical protein
MHAFLWITILGWYWQTHNDVTFIFQTKTPWPESANGHQQSDCRLSAMSVPTFEDRGYHVVSVTDPYSHFSSSSSVVLRRLSGPSCQNNIAQQFII